MYLRAAAFTLLNARLAIGWRCWLAYVTDVAKQQAQLRRSAAIFNKLLPPWNTWRAYCQSNSKLRGILMRGLNNQVYRAISKWQSHTSRCKTDELRLCRAVVHHADPRVRLWESWMLHVAGMTVLQHAASRIFSGRLCRGWASWREHLDACDQSDLARLSQTMDNELTRGWKRWRAQQASNQGYVNLATYASGVMRCRSLRRSFTFWSSHASNAAIATRFENDMADNYQLDRHATARRLVRLSKVHGKAIAQYDAKALRSELGRTRLLRWIIRAWGRLASLATAARHVNRRTNPSVLQAPELFGRTSMYDLLGPKKQRAWPRSWQEFFGWSTSWREAAKWLASLGIASTNIDAIQADMRNGEIFVRLARMLIKARYLPSWCSGWPETGYPGAMQALREFFMSVHVRSILGEPIVRWATSGHGSQMSQMSLTARIESRSVRGRITLATALKALTLIRVVLEVDMPDKFVAFCRGGNIFRPDVHAAVFASVASSDYQELFTRHTVDLPANAHDHKKIAKFCAQCGSVALARHNLTCGKCAVRTAIIRSCLMNNTL